MTEGYTPEGREGTKPAYVQVPPNEYHIIIQPQPQYGGPFYGDGYNNYGYNVPPGPAVVVVNPYPPYIDNICWHIFSFLFCNGCCCGLVGLILACQARSAFDSGNPFEASRLAYQAKRFAFMGIFFFSSNMDYLRY